MWLPLCTVYNPGMYTVMSIAPIMFTTRLFQVYLESKIPFFDIGLTLYRISCPNRSITSKIKISLKTRLVLKTRFSISFP